MRVEVLWRSDEPDWEALAAALVPPAWQRQAACVGVVDVDWFPERGGDGTAAKAVCARCPVRDACLAYALEHGIRYGVWGGRSWPERRTLRRPAA